MITNKNRDFLTRYGSEKHLDEIINHPNASAYDMMSNPYFNQSHAQKFIDTDHAEIRSIAQHPDVFEKLSSEQIDHLAGNRSTASILSNKIHQLEPHHIDSMLNIVDKHYDPSLAKNLGQMRKATPEQFHRMVKMDNDHMNQSLASNPNLPEEHIPRFMNSSIVINRMGIAKHPKLSLEHMETLANDENQFVRSKLATRKDLPIHLVHKLVHDESPSVRSEIFIHHPGV